MRQAQFASAQPRQVGGQDHAARMTGPVVDVEGRIVLDQVRVAGIAEDALDEIQVADEIAGREEPDLHRFLGFHARYLGTDHRTQQQRHEHPCRVGLPGGEGNQAQRLGRPQRVCEHAREHLPGHRLLVGGDRQSALGDMERALGGATVVGRVVQHALRGAEAGHDLRLESVLADRQRQLARDAMTIEDKCLRRQLRDLRQIEIDQVPRQELLDALVGRWMIGGQQAALLPVRMQQAVDRIHDLRRVADRHRRLPRGRQHEIDVQMQLGGRRQVVGTVLVQAKRVDCVHVCWILCGRAVARCASRVDGTPGLPDHGAGYGAVRFALRTPGCVAANSRASSSPRSVRSASCTPVIAKTSRNPVVTATWRRYAG